MIEQVKLWAKRIGWFLALGPAIVTGWLVFGSTYIKYETGQRILELCDITSNNNCFDQWEAMTIKVDYLWEHHQDNSGDN